MCKALKGCQKSKPIPNKINKQKEIIKNSSIPFQLDSQKHIKNIGLPHDLCFFTRAKTFQLSEKKQMQLQKANHNSPKIPKNLLQRDLTIGKSKK